MFMPVHGNGFGDPGGKNVLPGGMNAVRPVPDDVGGHYRHAAVLQILINAGHQGPVIVEFVVAWHKGVISDLRQAKGHDRRIRALSHGAGLQLDLRNRRALEQIPVVDEDDPLPAVNLAEVPDGGGNRQHVVGLRGIGQQVRVPALAVHVRGGEHGHVRIGFRAFPQGGEGKHRQQRQQQINQNADWNAFDGDRLLT